MKIFSFFLIALFVQIQSVHAAEMPPAWPWHGISIQNTEPFDPVELAQIVKSTHINSVQIRLMPRKVGEIKKIKDEAAWTESLDWGSKMLDQCKRLGIVGIMTVEGGFPLDPALPLMSNGKEFWSDRKRTDEAVQTAEKLSAFFANRGSELVAYQMLSEPLMYEGGKALSPPQWRGLMEKIIAAFRLHDAKRWVAVAPPPGGAPNLYKDFELFNSPRIIYGAHMYIPQTFTHQGILMFEGKTNTYPGYIGSKNWDKQALMEVMTPLKEFQQRHQVPVWIGEFGTIVWAKGGEQYILDLVDVFNAWNWSWTYFSLNGYFGWSPDYDNQMPNPMSTWPKHRVGATSLRWKTLRKAAGR